MNGWYIEITLSVRSNSIAFILAPIEEINFKIDMKLHINGAYVVGDFGCFFYQLLFRETLIFSVYVCNDSENSRHKNVDSL